ALARKWLEGHFLAIAARSARGRGHGPRRPEPDCAGAAGCRFLAVAGDSSPEPPLSLLRRRRRHGFGLLFLGALVFRDLEGDLEAEVLLAHAVERLPVADPQRIQRRVRGELGGGRLAGEDRLRVRRGDAELLV